MCLSLSFCVRAQRCHCVLGGISTQCHDQRPPPPFSTSAGSPENRPEIDGLDVVVRAIVRAIWRSEQRFSGIAVIYGIIIFEWSSPRKQEGRWAKGKVVRFWFLYCKLWENRLEGGKVGSSCVFDAKTKGKMEFKGIV